MSRKHKQDLTPALLVLPYLRVQNANAISSPLTHGFPSITAFAGLMWALQRKLAAAGIPLKLQQFGVICHDHQEQVTDGYVKTFRLTRNPVTSKGESAAIVEAGRIHLTITLIFKATYDTADDAGALGEAERDEQLAGWASHIGDIVASMRIAGGTVLPSAPMPGRRTRAWIEVLQDSDEEQAERFARWRRQWLPGYALVGRDDLLKDRHRELCEKQPDATLLDAWLHAARFNFEPVVEEAADTGHASADRKKVRWADPARKKGGGWTVPMTVGYAALTGPMPAGSVANARDPSIPFVFVEAVYSFGGWIGPHRLRTVDQLLWWPESDLETGLYRCRSGYQHDHEDPDSHTDDEDESD